MPWHLPCAHLPGATVVIRNVHDNKDQTFLQGHTDRVTCITMSKDGNLLASGQITHMGYPQAG